MVYTLARYLIIDCVLYADDIVLLLASCHGLQQLVNICNVYGTKWDIKFNPLKSQVITFGGQNPCCQIMLNSNQIPWVNYLETRSTLRARGHRFSLPQC